MVVIFWNSVLTLSWPWMKVSELREGLSVGCFCGVFGILSGVRGVFFGVVVIGFGAEEEA